MIFNHVTQTEDVMTTTIICLFVNVCRFVLFIAFIGALNRSIKEILFYIYIYSKGLESMAGMMVEQ